MKRPLPILGIIISLVFIALLLSPSVHWDGGVYRTFRIIVLDNETEDPIQGVELFMLRDEDFENLHIPKELEKKRMFMENMKDHGIGVSDRFGIIETGRDFGAGGYKGLFFINRGSFYVSGRLRLKKEGYEDFEALLENTLGDKHYPLSKKHFEFTIYLERKTEPVGTGQPM